MLSHADAQQKAGDRMPKLIGLICALVALAACVIQKADPTASILRALAAFMAGSLLTKAWYALLAARLVQQDSGPTESQDRDRAA